MYPKTPIFQKCLETLNSLPNIQEATVREEPYLSENVLADGSLRIKTSQQSIDYICEIKTHLTYDSIEAISEYFKNLSFRLKDEVSPLLITSDLSNLVAEKLAQNNIEFIDIKGTIYLNRPTFYVFVKNNTVRSQKRKSLNITNSSLQVMYAVLEDWRWTLQPIDVDRVSQLSGVSLKTVKRTLDKLQDLNYIQYGVKTGYKIIDPLKLLERWELGYSESLRNTLMIENFSPIGNRKFFDIAEAIDQFASIHDYLIGGELAAAKLTKYLRPIHATLHLNPNFNLRKIALDLKLKPDPNGSITFLRNFGEPEPQWSKVFRQEKYIVSPFLIRAELVRMSDSRLKKTAQLIYDKYIKCLPKI
ncbi:type IV toxin-antitoxin system AbiEi family antitoxin [Baaleninema simplex]|uniref:type IV toxin-antitoxin system AbiEi family antitoxin n=1 Tax=Baaleninema simplex TaxID=2862350 RepID=UPI00035F3103|nr:type IV toxin-antitoxin system AbiEi family antitoxin [Baaleninema simplex]